MGTELFTLTPDTVVGSALRLASAKDVHHFLVIEEGNLTGIVCASDLKQARVGSQVSGCMRTPVLCIGPETTVGDAADIMAENAVGCLPVVTGAFLVGILTRNRIEEVTGKTVVAARPTLDLDGQGDRDDRSCAACGSTDGVRAHARAGLLDLCTDCAAIVPALEVPRGN
jgi:CBS domain-containing protein